MSVMRNNESKSFYKTFDSGKTKLFYTDPHQVNRSKNEPILEQFNFEKLLNQLFHGIKKLFVVLKYMFFAFILKPAQKFQFPWFKVSFLSLMVLILLKEDLHFTINLPSADAKIAKYDEEAPVSKNETWFAAGASLVSDHRPATAQKAVAKVPIVKKKRKKKKALNPFAPLDTDALDELETKAYIRRFEKIAVTEMHKFGIPASIKMAQGIIESHNGKSRLARKNNNHFGVKCFSKKCVKGHCANFNDDHHKDFFRKYPTNWYSWRSHSELLSNGRYQQLQKYGKDYKKWAMGLKTLGYATDKNYAQKLIKTIEKYQLYVLDKK